MASATVLASLLLYVHVHAAAAATDTLSQGQSLAGDEALVSANGTFALAFFAPEGGDPARRYLGVLYRGAARQTAAWVANRDAPASAASASATVTRAGELQVLDGDRVIWCTNTTKPPGAAAATAAAGNFTLTILDSGNLELTAAGGGGGDRETVWESFLNPGDTFLPGMIITLDRRSSNQTLFTSWRSSGDPGTGNYTLGLDPLGSGQIHIWQGKSSTPYWRSGQWASTNFVGIPWRPMYIYGFRFSGDRQSEDPMSYTYSSYNTSLLRFVLLPNGTEACYMLLDGAREWEHVWSQPTTQCHLYNTCGANAICTAATGGAYVATCNCLQGYQPKSVEEWNARNWSRGCVRRTPLGCQQNTSIAIGKDRFAVVRGVKLPDFADWRTTVSDANACEQACLANCSCGAYTYSSGTACLTWGQELVDIYQFPQGGAYDLHIKLPASEFATGPKRKLWTAVAIVVITVAAVLVACSIVWYKCRRRITESFCKGTRRGEVKGHTMLHPGRDAGKPGNLTGPTLQCEEEEAEDGGKSCKLPTFTFECIAAATANFSDSNKLGEGGFGRVYKGEVQGREVAVKRLSRISTQGEEEFKNEAKLIIKLQHRNLVRLLGCCIQGEEKILVYEYMPNKSLDDFLFDHARKVLLDWRRRFQIVEGIARGLLYLHRDSRLRVVHRDLKTSNILLDKEMNPKISDFGTARIFGGDQNQANTNRAVGTLGYMSPEYLCEGLFSFSSDVYSFGIIMLEIITGQKISSFRDNKDFLSIVDYAWKLWDAGNGEQLVEPSLRSYPSCPAGEVVRCVHIALLCVQDHAQDRPDIQLVIRMLGGGGGTLPAPQPPTFTAQFRRLGRAKLREQEESFFACDLTITALQGR